MADLNATIPILEPMFSLLQGIMRTAEVIVGGIFGLYVILIVLRWYEARQTKKLLIRLNETVKEMEGHVAKMANQTGALSKNVERIEQMEEIRIKKSKKPARKK
jgi:hypothetical protein